MFWDNGLNVLSMGKYYLVSLQELQSPHPLRILVHKAQYQEDGIFSIAQNAKIQFKPVIRRAFATASNGLICSSGSSRCNRHGKFITPKQNVTRVQMASLLTTLHITRRDEDVTVIGTAGVLVGIKGLHEKALPQMSHG